jgi:hypothetical protein
MATGLTGLLSLTSWVESYLPLFRKERRQILRSLMFGIIDAVNFNGF